MRVVCDNCGAVYKIPDEKLVKPVNKATCRACGHRMLIPRPPRPDEFEDEERTLIKERPLQAHPPMMVDGDRLTAPIDQDEPEETLPRVRPPSVSTPPPRPQNEARPSYGRTPVAPRPRYPDAAPSQPPRRGPAPKHPVFGEGLDEETVWVKNPPTGARRRKFEAGSISPDEQPTRPAMPPLPGPHSEPRRERTPAAVAERTATPAPSRRRAASDRHDPAGDMTLVALAIAATLMGVLILGVDIPTGLAWFDALIKPLLGLVLAFGGLFTAALVLITGGRGRRPAWKVTSLLTGMAGALLVAGGFAAGSAALQHYTGATTLFESGGSDQPSTATVLGGQLQSPDPEDVVDDTDAVAEPVPDEIETVAVAAPPPPAPTVDTTPRPSPRPAPRPALRPAPAPVAAPVPAPAPRPVRVEPRPEPEPIIAAIDTDEDLLDADPIVLTAPDPAPAPAPSGALETVPMEALDVMLRNNLEVKKCFFTYMQAEGALPSRVDVRFTLETNGRATGVSVTQAAYAGTDLETCLRSAIGGITFPPTQSSSKITYPFIFQ